MGCLPFQMHGGVFDKKTLVEKTDGGCFELPIAFNLFFWSKYKQN
jgi:hypothetical protein